MLFLVSSLQSYVRNGDAHTHTHIQGEQPCKRTKLAEASVQMHLSQLHAFSNARDLPATKLHSKN